MNSLEKIKDNVSKVMIGQEETLKLLLSALAACGHCLLEDVPGTGKTLLAKSLSRSMDFTYSRVSFTPDLLPTDVTGLSYYNEKEGEFIFREGPVFTNLLLADEINRATPRTQSALLECMGEGQVTVDGKTRVLSAPFFVIATQNPVETLGCFPLPEAQLDRFLMQVEMQPLSQEEELSLIDRFITQDPLASLEKVVTQEEVLELQRQCRLVYVHKDLKSYIVSLVQSSRSADSHEGISPRGTLSLLRASQGYALVSGRTYLVPEDIRAVAVPVLAHRYLCEGLPLQAKRQRILNLLATTPVPTEDWSRP